MIVYLFSVYMKKKAIISLCVTPKFFPDYAKFRFFFLKISTANIVEKFNIRIELYLNLIANLRSY